MTEALLVIDMQKKFYRGTGKELMDASVPVINEAIKKFRTKGAPVIWTKHTNQKWRLIEGSPGFEIVDSLVPEKDESVVVKTQGNAFLATDLDSILKERGIEQLFVCGYAAEACVHRTYSGGLKLGYYVWKIKNATASSSRFLLNVFSHIGKYEELSSIG